MESPARDKQSSLNTTVKSFIKLTPGRERERDKAQLLSPTHTGGSSSMTPPGTSSAPGATGEPGGNGLTNNVYSTGVAIS